MTLTYCGHATKRPSGICKACIPMYREGIIPLYDGRYKPWRKHERKVVERSLKTNYCACGAEIVKGANKCRTCFNRSMSAIRSAKYQARNEEIKELVRIGLHQGGNRASLIRQAALKYGISVTNTRKIVQDIQPGV